MKQFETIKAIINRKENFGMLAGVLTLNSDTRKIVNLKLKEGNAKLIIDTEDTLMYDLKFEII